MVKQTLVFDGGGGGEEEGLPKHLTSNQIKNKNTKTIKKGREYTRHASTGGVLDSNLRVLNCTCTSQLSIRFIHIILSN